jgi:TolB-like protein
MELQEVLPLKYVLSGTLVKHQDGILVNARIIGLQSKAVVASAQGFLPERIVKALLSSEETDGIKLVQG